MNFETYINEAWNLHVTDSQKAFNNLAIGFELLADEKDVLSLAHFILHVSGEHLQNFTEGILALKNLEKKITVTPETKNILLRGQAILEIASGIQVELEKFSTSDQIIIYARLSAIKVEMKKISEAKKVIDRALNLVSLHELPGKDPAFRVLAIVGNNTASTLEEKMNRTIEEAELMLFMAQIARVYWEKAGTWMEVERAEYRLSASNLQASYFDRALIHAENCLRICQENNAPALEFFFGYEMLAKVEQGRGNSVGFNLALIKMKENFERLASNDQAWCKEALSKIEKL